MLDQLTAHKCPDLTKQLDLAQINQYPSSGGGFGRVYRGKLRKGTDIALKCLHTRVEISDIKKLRKVSSVPGDFS